MIPKHIDTLIFDLGGVIINLDIPATGRAFHALAEKYGNTNYHPNPEHELFPLFEKGMVSPEEFRSTIKSYVAPEAQDKEIDNAWNAMLLDIPRERLELLEKVGKSHRIFLLSNTNAIHLPAFQNIIKTAHGLDAIDGFFEKAYYSHYLGMRKPDTEIFEHILSDGQIEPSKAVFLDDMPPNLEGAEKTGLNTIHITDTHHIHIALSNLL